MRLSAGARRQVQLMGDRILREWRDVGYTTSGVTITRGTITGRSTPDLLVRVARLRQDVAALTALHELGYVPMDFDAFHYPGGLPDPGLF